MRSIIDGMERESCKVMDDYRNGLLSADEAWKQHDAITKTLASISDFLALKQEVLRNRMSVQRERLHVKVLGLRRSF